METIFLFHAIQPKPIAISTSTPFYSNETEFFPVFSYLRIL